MFQETGYAFRVQHKPAGSEQKYHLTERSKLILKLSCTSGKRE